MKNLIALLASVLLVTLAIAGSSRHRALSAAPMSPRVWQADGSAVHRDWRIAAPVSFANLTVFPIVSDRAGNTDDFITLDEGLRTRKVVVSELGADGSTRVVRGRRRASDNAEVNRLALTNYSGKKLILIAGEMVIGGKQDRIVGHDCIIEATGKPVPIDVFCVEHGRWSGDEEFGHSRGQRIGRDDGGVGAAVMAMPEVREKAQATKSQSEVWDGVAKSAAANNVNSSTGDLKSVYRDKTVSRKLADYERAVKNGLAATNVIGVVAAVNGRVISADAFTNHRLFMAYWPKMLKSYALTAVSSAGEESTAVARSDAEAFLDRADGASTASADKGVYRLVENQSSKDASFELVTGKSARGLVHFNHVKKQ